ncbi:MAG: HAMP domain-containing histidine kinase [Methanosarcinales archaeon]|jgi:signal transduction histidine kinase|nr:HAMP domain-containing histidine kinase [Methanosarcinales archaeon]
MSQNPKKCTAPHAFTPKEENMMFDASKSSIPYQETLRSADEIHQSAFVFLHDILNSAGGLHGFLELMTESDDPEKLKKYASKALILCDSLIEEIEYHRDFLRAENNTFRPVMEETKTYDILKLAALKLKMHHVSKGRTIEITDDSNESVITNKVLLSHILVNMVKNAIEATEEGGTVLIGAEKRGDYMRFWVHNEGVIPDDLQKQLFDINASTKGAHRGLGLFSIQMLGEKALGGRVHFKSTKEKGTCFCIDLPPVP